MKILVLTILLTLWCGNSYYELLNKRLIIELLDILKEIRNEKKSKSPTELLYSYQPESIKQLNKFRKDQYKKFENKFSHLKFNITQENYLVIIHQKAYLLSKTQRGKVPFIFGPKNEIDTNTSFNIIPLKTNDTLEIEKIILNENDSQEVTFHSISALIKINQQTFLISYEELIKLMYENENGDNNYPIESPAILCEKKPGPIWSYEYRLKKYMNLSNAFFKSHPDVRHQGFYLKTNDNKSQICVDFQIENLEQLIFLNLTKNTIISNSEFI